MGSSISSPWPRCPSSARSDKSTRSPSCSTRTLPKGSKRPSGERSARSSTSALCGLAGRQPGATLGRCGDDEHVYFLVVVHDVALAEADRYRVLLAVAGVYLIGAGSAVEGIFAVAAGHQIGPVAAADLVVAPLAVEDVVAPGRDLSKAGALNSRSSGLVGKAHSNSMKINKAAKLMMLLGVCNLPQRTSNRRARSGFLSMAGSSNLLLVGNTMMRV